MRLFLTEAGYGKALKNQDKGFIRIYRYDRDRRMYQSLSLRKGR